MSALLIFIGLIATMCTGLSVMVQLVRLFKKKKSSGISLMASLALCPGLLCWIWFASMINSWSLGFANIIALILNLVLVMLNLYYQHQNNRGPVFLQKYPNLRKAITQLNHKEAI